MQGLCRMSCHMCVSGITFNKMLPCNIWNGVFKAVDDGKKSIIVKCAM